MIDLQGYLENCSFFQFLHTAVAALRVRVTGTGILLLQGMSYSPLGKSANRGDRLASVRGMLGGYSDIDGG